MRPVSCLHGFSRNRGRLRWLFFSLSLTILRLASVRITVLCFDAPEADVRKVWDYGKQSQELSNLAKSLGVRVLQNKIDASPLGIQPCQIGPAQGIGVTGLIRYKMKQIARSSSMKPRRPGFVYSRLAYL